MYIKRITIQGFKTYKNATVIDLLSLHHNVVIGRNGLGKSNFFSAIRFVLSDAYTHMTREERKALIHEGSGNVMSAYVEVVFDNTDRRFPLAKDEVSIRRTIGLKKDDYSLDGRSATRSDVMNLLESAGFCRSNPYYIVPQGKIMSLTNSKDSERLLLLKEVSGAKVFEAKLKESKKELANSDNKKKRIDEALQSLADRLSDLQIESHDLKDYQQLERRRKTLEYRLFDRELKTLQEQIEANEAKYTELLSTSHADLEELTQREKACQSLFESISSLKTSLKVVTLQKEQAEADHKQLYSLIAQKQADEEALAKEISLAKTSSDDRDEQVARLEVLIQQHEAKLAESLPQLKELQAKEADVSGRLDQLKAEQRSLFAKQGRFDTFSTREERDDWLKNEIDVVSGRIKESEPRLADLSSAVQTKEAELAEATAQITTLDSQLDEAKRHQRVEGLTESINQLRERILELTEHRKTLWRDEIRIRSVQDSLTHDINTANHQVNQTMDRVLSKGLTSVRHIVDQFKLHDKVFGMLAECFSVSEKYKMAAEVVAGNSLFHVVVDTDETASVIMKELARTNGGRVTFMPLNRLLGGQQEFPDPLEFEHIPLLSKIKHDKARVGAAMKQVFGHTAVCANLAKASEFSRKYGISAITLEGDRADPRGALTGGWRDYKHSRIDAFKQLTKKKKEHAKAVEEFARCQEQIVQVSEELAQANVDLQKKNVELDQVLSASEPVTAELLQVKNHRCNVEHELVSIRAEKASVESSLRGFKSALEQHQQELESEFTGELSTEEKARLSQLVADIDAAQTELEEIVTESAGLETTVAQLELELDKRLRLHLYELQSEADGWTHHHEVEHGAVKRELQSLRQQLQRAELRLETYAKEVDGINEQIASLETQIKHANEQQIKVVKKLEKFSKISEKSLSQKSLLQQRRDEVERRIAELGGLPEDAFEDNSQSADELLSQLKQVNGDLSRYAHINKKAMEQHVTFTRERDDLLLRQADLEHSRESIEQLIGTLEQQKDEAILKLFEQVQTNFHRIFGKLVPAGVGHLTLLRRDDALDSIDSCTGVLIEVSFNSKEDEQQHIEQLSGGQKSLCAIALIFAIQQCDPAPFYLFDEIDANLDTQYRTAVASMLQSLSQSAQFICTTFRPEMLQVADKFYGVMYGDKVSTVSDISLEEAMSFVEQR